MCFYSNAQTKDTVMLNAFKRFHSLKFSPLHLINPIYPTIQLAYEFQLNKQQSIQVDVGYALSTNLSPKFQDSRGIKLKGEHRYYFNQFKKGKVRLYVASEVYWNRIDFDRETRQTECFDLNCQNTFRRTYIYEVSYQEIGSGLKYGIMLVNHRFVFDFNAGLAIRKIDYNKPTLPPAQFGNEFDGWIQIPNEENRVAPGLMLGVRLGYQLSRN
jgi:Protein of unknown function (DUF3575)